MIEALTFGSIFLLGAGLVAICSYPRTSFVERGLYNSLIITAVAMIPILGLGILAAGLRPENAGFDTARYVYTYARLTSPLSAVTDGAHLFGNTELLWWPLQSLLKPFFSPSGWLFTNFMLVVAATWLSYRSISRSYRLSAALFIFVFSTFFVVYAGNGMRQALAVPVGMLAFLRYFDKRYPSSLALAVLSIGLHWSALVLLAAPVMRLGFFKKRYAYFGLPIVCLCLSSVMSKLALVLTDGIGFSGFSRKYELYFSGRESHVGEVWQLANFWLCSSLSLVFLAAWAVSKDDKRVLPAFISLHLSLIFFGIRIPDFAERYLLPLFFVLPLVVALLIRWSSLPKYAKNAALFTFFFIMTFLVYVNRNAQLTLGYNLS